MYFNNEINYFKYKFICISILLFGVNEFIIIVKQSKRFIRQDKNYPVFAVDGRRLLILKIWRGLHGWSGCVCWPIGIQSRDISGDTLNPWMVHEIQGLSLEIGVVWLLTLGGAGGPFPTESYEIEWVNSEAYIDKLGL